MAGTMEAFARASRWTSWAIIERGTEGRTIAYSIRSCYRILEAVAISVTGEDIAFVDGARRGNAQGGRGHFTRRRPRRRRLPLAPTARIA